MEKMPKRNIIENKYVFSILGGGRVSQNFISSMKVVYDFLNDFIPPSRINVILPETSTTAKFIRDPMKWAEYSTKGLEIEVISGSMSKTNRINIEKNLEMSDLIISAYSGIKWSELVKFDKPRMKEIEVNGPIAKIYSSFIPSQVKILNITNQTEVMSTIFYNQMKLLNKENQIIPFGMCLDAIRAGTFLNNNINEKNLIGNYENIKRVDVCGLHGLPIINTSRCKNLEGLLQDTSFEKDTKLIAELIKEEYEIKQYVSEFPKQIVKKLQYLPDVTTGSAILDIALDMVGLKDIIFSLKENITMCKMKNIEYNINKNKIFNDAKISNNTKKSYKEINKEKQSFLDKDEIYRESSGFPVNVTTIIDLYNYFREENEKLVKSKTFQELDLNIKTYISSYININRQDLDLLKNTTEKIFFCGNERYLSQNNYNIADRIFAYQGFSDLIEAHIMAAKFDIL